MRSHGCFKFVGENSEVFLPPQITHALLAGNFQIGPVCRDRRLGCASVEQADSQRTIVHRLGINFQITFAADLHGLFAKRVLIHIQNFIVAQKSQREVIQFFKIAAEKQRADSKHHKLMCVYCSSGVSLVGRNGPNQPTCPTTSMSGSLK